MLQGLPDVAFDIFALDSVQPSFVHLKGGGRFYVNLIAILNDVGQRTLFSIHHTPHRMVAQLRVNVVGVIQQGGPFREAEQIPFR